jgi:hypothetical protein
MKDQSELEDLIPWIPERKPYPLDTTSIIPDQLIGIHKNGETKWYVPRKQLWQV